MTERYLVWSPYSFSAGWRGFNDTGQDPRAFPSALRIRYDLTLMSERPATASPYARERRDGGYVSFTYDRFLDKENDDVPKRFLNTLGVCAGYIHGISARSLAETSGRPQFASVELLAGYCGNFNLPEEGANNPDRFELKAEFTVRVNLPIPDSDDKSRRGNFFFDFRLEFPTLACRNYGGDCSFLPIQYGNGIGAGITFGFGSTYLSPKETPI